MNLIVNKIDYGLIKEDNFIINLCKKTYAKIYKKMTANDSKSYLPYLNKLVDQYNNTFHHSINTKPINAEYSALIEKIETNPKILKF